MKEVPKICVEKIYVKVKEIESTELNYRSQLIRILIDNMGMFLCICKCFPKLEPLWGLHSSFFRFVSFGESWIIKQRDYIWTSLIYVLRLKPQLERLSPSKPNCKLSPSFLFFCNKSHFISLSPSLYSHNVKIWIIF
jgi:hypothetical protein